MQNILVKFEKKEFDYHIVAYKIFKEDDWESFMENCEMYNNPKGLDIYFGHSDFLHFKSGKEFLEYCAIQYRVTNQEISLLKKLHLNLDSHNILETVAEMMKD
jgi:hypothetical protein